MMQRVALGSSMRSLCPDRGFLKPVPFVLSKAQAAGCQSQRRLLPNSLCLPILILKKVADLRAHVCFGLSGCQWQMLWVSLFQTGWWIFCRAVMANMMMLDALFQPIKTDCYPLQRVKSIWAVFL